MLEKHRIRAIILEEFRRGRSEKHACERLNGQFEQRNISLSTVRLWYKRFKQGDTTLLDKNDRSKSAASAKPTLAANPNTLFKSHDSLLDQGFTTSDGRLAFVFRYEHPHKFFTAIDLFHGKSISISIKGDPLVYEPDCKYTIRAIADDCLTLVVRKSGGRVRYLPRVYLLKFDLASGVCHVLARATGLRRGVSERMLLNSCEDGSFVIINSNLIQHGQLINRRLVMDPREYVLQPTTFCLSSEGEIIRGVVPDVFFMNKSYFFSFNWKTYEIGDRINTAPTKSLVGDIPDWSVIDIEYFAWSRDSLVVSLYGDSENAFHRLDLKTYVWSPLNIKLPGKVTSLYVDQEEFLTVSTHNKAVRAYEMDQNTIYRFAPRRPDSLVNLAWKAIRHHHDFNKSDLYERVFKRLPLNSHLPCVFPDI